MSSYGLATTLLMMPITHLKKKWQRLLTWLLKWFKKPSLLLVLWRPSQPTAIMMPIQTISGILKQATKLFKTPWVSGNPGWTKINLSSTWRLATTLRLWSSRHPISSKCSQSILWAVTSSTSTPSQSWVIPTINLTGLQSSLPILRRQRA